MFYTLIEIQMNNGTGAVVPPTIYTDETSALSAYFTKCASASVSEIEYHAVNLLQSNGLIYKQEIFDRRAGE